MERDWTRAVEAYANTPPEQRWRFDVFLLDRPEGSPDEAWVELQARVVAFLDAGVQRIRAEGGD